MEGRLTGILTLTPGLQLSFPAPVLALLLELLGKLRKFALAKPVQRTELVENADGVHPLRVQEQALEVFKPLGDSGCCALLLLDKLLQPALLFVESREFLLQFRTIPEQLLELVVVVIVLLRC